MLITVMMAPSVLLVERLVTVVTVAMPADLHPREAAPLDYWRQRA
jgi:hypothetical protein